MEVRPSLIAGRWYPGDPEILVWELDQYLKQAEVCSPPGNVWGVVVPHAGYHYSGGVAAHAFKCLRGLNPDLVVVISPLHHAHPARIVTTAYDAYTTPLGFIEVDTQMLERLDHRLQARHGYGMAWLERDGEHALEIELPFLQQIVGQFRLLPVMMRDQRLETAKTLGLTLAEIVKGQNVLFVASSDLSHFYPQTEASALDQEMLHRLEAFDPEGILQAERDGRGYACGRGAMAATLWATQALGADRVTILDHATSGDISGDYEAVVGYGAAVIWQEKPKKSVATESENVRFWQ